MTAFAGFAWSKATPRLRHATMVRCHVRYWLNDSSTVPLRRPGLTTPRRSIERRQGEEVSFPARSRRDLMRSAPAWWLVLVCDALFWTCSSCAWLRISGAERP